MFFFEDPHQLYKHWPAETWSAIDQHQAKQGMSELQAAFALGANISSGEGDTAIAPLSLSMPVNR